LRCCCYCWKWWLKIRIPARSAGVDVQQWNVIPLFFPLRNDGVEYFESQCLRLFCYSFMANFCFSLWNIILLYPPVSIVTARFSAYCVGADRCEIPLYLIILLLI
jgi:hypothetical protein